MEGFEKNTGLKIWIVIVLLNISCTNNSAGEPEFRIASDTIYSPSKINNQDCYAHAKGYFNKYGFSISNFYEEVDYGFTDLDQDGWDDTISILTPKNRILPSIYEECQEEAAADRILLVKVGERSKIFRNIIRNETGPGTVGVEHIEKTNDGFRLQYRLGQACYLKYDISIKFISNDLFISKIHLNSGCPGEKENINEFNYSHTEFPLGKFRREFLDSLQTKNLER